MKKTGKTTSPFRYDLNKILYDYTVEVRNRFKGLHLVDRVPKELWTEVPNRRQRPKPSPSKEIWEGQSGCLRRLYKIAEERREAKGKGERERYTHLNAEFQITARRDKKAFFSDQCEEIEENNGMGKTRDLFKKIRHTKGTFHARMVTMKDRNGMDLTEAEDIKKRWQEHKRTVQKRSSRPR